MHYIQQHSQAKPVRLINERLHACQEIAPVLMPIAEDRVASPCGSDKKRALDMIIHKTTVL